MWCLSEAHAQWPKAVTHDHVETNTQRPVLVFNNHMTKHNSQIKHEQLTMIHDTGVNCSDIDLVETFS